jgi:hypothetical protein
MVEHVVADRVHQMGLAESHAAVDEQRVIGPRWRLRDGAACRVGKLVRRPDDERLEGVAGSQSADRSILGGGVRLGDQPVLQLALEIRWRVEHRG